MTVSCSFAPSLGREPVLHVACMQAPTILLKRTVFWRPTLLRTSCILPATRSGKLYQELAPVRSPVRSAPDQSLLMGTFVRRHTVFSAPLLLKPSCLRAIARMFSCRASSSQRPICLLSRPKRERLDKSTFKISS